MRSSGSCSEPVASVESWREMALGDGQGESKWEVMMSSCDPEAMFESVWSRSAFASGSSSSVEEESMFFANRI